MALFIKDQYGNLSVNPAEPKTFLLWVIILLFTLTTLFNTILSVKAGTVKVITRFGKVTGRVLYPGLNFKCPFIEGVLTYNTQKITYETMEENKIKEAKANYKDFAVSTTTKDGQDVDLTYTIRFRVDSTKATWLAENIGPEEAIVEKIVKTDSRTWVRTVVRDFSSGDLYSGNIREIQEKIWEVLEPKFNANGLIVDEILLKEPTFSADYEKVMESKQIALEQVKVEEHKATQEEFKKKQRITQAEGYAKEQELQKLTLTPEILQKMWIEAWEKGGSKVPQVISGNSPFMFNLPSLEK